MNPSYQFDDPDWSLPLWKVKHQDPIYRESRRPFFKHEEIVRAANRQAAIDKVKSAFSSHDMFSASKQP